MKKNKKLKWLVALYGLFFGVISQPLWAINNSGADIVTLKNGDSYNGTVAHEYFEIETAFGNVRIPYVAMALWSNSGALGSDRIETHQGEIFYGKLIDKELKLLRVLGPVLPIDTDDILEISFTTRVVRQRFNRARDSIEMENGMRFFGQIAVSEFVLQSVDSIHSFPASDIHLIDFASLYDGEELASQVMLNNGHYFQGKPFHQQLQVQTRFGQRLMIPLAELTTLAFNVNRELKQAHFDYRRRLLGQSRLQDYLTDESPAPEMVVLRGGEFIRGQKQGDRDELTAPTSPKPFAISVFEITFAEFDRFCEDTNRSKPDDGGFGRGFRPVINVTWHDAKAYTEWLSRKTRQTYRLPSDAEWEYAMRGGTTSRYWWSEELLQGLANCSGCGSIWDGEKTAPVGRFPPNPFGLHDTAGNVFEWVEDCFHNDFLKAPRDGSAYVIEGCGQRVIRGGAWSFPPAEVRSANRWRDIPTRRSDDTGFRVARDLD